MAATQRTFSGTRPASYSFKKKTCNVRGIPPKLGIGMAYFNHNLHQSVSPGYLNPVFNVQLQSFPHVQSGSPPPPTWSYKQTTPSYLSGATLVKMTDADGNISTINPSKHGATSPNILSPRINLNQPQKSSSSPKISPRGGNVEKQEARIEAPKLIVSGDKKIKERSKPIIRTIEVPVEIAVPVERVLRKMIS